MTTQYKAFKDLTHSEKQDLASDYIATQTVYLMNDEVEYILSKSHEDYENVPFSYDDITNYKYYGGIEISGEWHQLTEDERDTKLEFYEYLRDKAVDLMDSCIRDNGSSEDASLAQNRLDARYTRYADICIDLESMHFDNLPEIYQWFLCSDHLIRELEEKGECTLDDQYWGRQCCGQSITMDYVIQKIAYEYMTTFAYMQDNKSVGAIEI
jgi:hypothetical protein